MSIAPESHAQTSLAARFEQWIAGGGRRIGQVVLISSGEGWLLVHGSDQSRAGTGMLRRYGDPHDAVDIARYTDDGAFRPLKTAPNLATGWELALKGLDSVRLALDFLYPSAFANWVRWCDREATAPPLREVLSRQTGIYRLTGMITDDEARETVGTVCAGHNCMRRILWELAPGVGWEGLPPEKTAAPACGNACPPDLPILCTDPCAIFLEAARKKVRARRGRASAGDGA